MISKNKRDYIIWQNRALDFYIAARLCIRNELYLSAAFAAQQSIETLLKATLLYWDKSFSPESAGHAIKKQVKMLRNKVNQQSDFEIPEYFYHEQRYQSVSRYPKQGRGIGIPATMLDDLDRVFADLIEMVPFQFNSTLTHALTGKHWGKLVALRRSNAQMRRLRKSVGAKLDRKYIINSNRRTAKK